MFDPYTSANDPAFYLHHSFVDYIWEIFRQRKQVNEFFSMNVHIVQAFNNIYDVDNSLRETILVQYLE